MASEARIADVISEKNAILVLTYMSYMDEKPKVSDFNEYITNFHVLESAIKSLEDAELIKTETITKPRKTTYLEYTEKGKIISYLLQQINEICINHIETPKLSKEMEIIIK